MDYKKQISELIKIDNVSADEIYSLLALPKDSANGDYCLPCFKFAKVLRTSPMVIAQNIASSIEKVDFLSKVEAVAGYVNFTLNKTQYSKLVLDKVNVEGRDYGKSTEGNGKTICLDYSSVNIAKPFHMGHLLNTVIGGALYRIHKELGYNVIGINHLGDWGTQFGKLIVAFKKWGNKEDIDKRGVRGLLEIYVKFHKEAEIHPELDDEARAWFKAIEDGNEEALELFHWFKDITLKEVAKIYDRLDIVFDSCFIC